MKFILLLILFLINDLDMNGSDDGPLSGPILSEIPRNTSPKKDLPPLVQYPKWSRNRRLSLESNGSRPSTQENLEELSEHITLLVQVIIYLLNIPNIKFIIKKLT